MINRLYSRPVIRFTLCFTDEGGALLVFAAALHTSAYNIHGKHSNKVINDNLREIYMFLISLISCTGILNNNLNTPVFSPSIRIIRAIRQSIGGNWACIT